MLRIAYTFLVIPLTQSILPLLPSPALPLEDAWAVELLLRAADDELMAEWPEWDAWLPRLLERAGARYSKMRASDIVGLV